MNRVLVLAGLILLAGNLVGCAGKTGMSFEELKQKLADPRSRGLVICEAGYGEPGNTTARGAVDIVKERLGSPYKEQVLGDFYYLYYYVHEGTAQIEVTYDPTRPRGVSVRQINLL